MADQNSNSDLEVTEDVNYEQVEVFNLYSKISHLLRSIRSKFKLGNEIRIDLINLDGNFTNLSKKQSGDWAYITLKPRETYVLSEIQENESWKSKQSWQPYLESLEEYPNIKERIEFETVPGISQKQKRDKRGRLVMLKNNDG